MTRAVWLSAAVLAASLVACSRESAPPTVNPSLWRQAQLDKPDGRFAIVTP